MLQEVISLYFKANYWWVLISSIIQLGTTLTVSYGWINMMSSLQEFIKINEEVGFRFWVLFWLMASVADSISSMLVKLANSRIQNEIKNHFNEHSYLAILDKLAPDNRHTLNIDTFLENKSKCWSSMEEIIAWVPELVQMTCKIVITTYYVSRINMYAAAWVFTTYAASCTISHFAHFAKVTKKRVEDNKCRNKISALLNRINTGYGIPSRDHPRLIQSVDLEKQIFQMEMWYTSSWNRFHLIMDMTKVITTAGILLFVSPSNMITILTITLDMQNSMNMAAWFLGRIEQSRGDTVNYLKQTKELMPYCTHTQTSSMTGVSQLTLHNLDLNLTKGKKVFNLFCQQLTLVRGINRFAGGTGNGKTLLMKAFAGGFSDLQFRTDGGPINIHSVRKAYIGGSILGARCTGSFEDMCPPGTSIYDMKRALIICNVYDYVMGIGGISKPLSGSDDVNVKSTESTGQMERINVAAELAGLSDGTMLFLDEIVGGLEREMAQSVLENIGFAFPHSIIVLVDHVPENYEALEIVQTVTMNKGMVTVTR